MELHQIDSNVDDANATKQASKSTTYELNELQLAFVGGGNVIITLG